MAKRREWTDISPPLDFGLGAAGFQPRWLLEISHLYCDGCRRNEAGPDGSGRNLEELQADGGIESLRHVDL